MIEKDKEAINYNDTEFTKYILTEMIKNDLDFETLLNDMYKTDSENYIKAKQKINNFLNIKNIDKL